jgi:hypothetical protein
MTRPHKTASRRRIKRSLSRKSSLSKPRGLAKSKKPTRKAPAKVGKALTRRKATTRVKFASRRKKPASKALKKRVQRRVDQDPRLEIAVKDMNRGSSLTEAARSVSLSRKDLQSFIKRRRLVIRKGDRWTIKDNRPRRVPVITRGRIRVVTVDGFKEASRAGAHYQAAGNFVQTNNLQVIKPFDGRSVRSANGKEIALETDPNALHRVAAMDFPPFHEIYEIISPT